MHKVQFYVPLAFTGLGVPVELQCRSTVTWTGCVAAVALEDGHVLPTSTWQTLPSSVPSAWALQTHRSEPMRLCGRESSSASCKSVTYSTFGMNYSHVCGRVIGYQSGGPDAFANAACQTIEGILCGWECPWHMGLLDQGNTPGPLLLDITENNPSALSTLVMSMCWPCYSTVTMSPPLWEMTTFVRVGTPT